MRIIPLDDICESVILHPPIAPAFAVIVPDRVAFDAVIVPFALTLKLDADIKKSLPVADPLKKNPLPVIASCVIPNPPILPAFAVIVPDKVAFDAVIVPSALTLKLDEDIKKSLPVADPLKKNPVPDMASLVIVNPPILPAVALIVPSK